MIRYAGLFSNRWKEQYQRQARDALNQSRFHRDYSDEDTQPTWAERQIPLFSGSIDPLICPNCDKPLIPQGGIGTFFGNWNELKYVFDIAGKDSTIPPAILRPG